MNKSVCLFAIAAAAVAPWAHAASSGSGFARLDWHSVSIEATPGTQYAVLGHEASILFADNVPLPVVGGTPYTLVASDLISVAPQLQVSWTDPGLGRVLAGVVDLGAGQTLQSQSSRVNSAGSRFDASNSSWMLLLHSDAGGSIRVQGGYELGLEAAVQLPGESALAVVFANLRLYDPASGQILFDDTRDQQLSLGFSAGPRSDARADKGSFNDLIDLPAGTDVRLFFTVSSAATLAAVPEPHIQLMLAFGLLSLALCRRRGNQP